MLNPFCTGGELEVGLAVALTADTAYTKEQSVAARLLEIPPGSSIAED